MNDKDIDQALRETAAAQHVESAQLDRITASLCADLRPVRPLPPLGLQVTALAAVSAVLAWADAAYLGLYGIERLGAVRIAGIFSALTVLLVLASRLSAGAMVPGSKRILQPGAMLVAGSLGLALLFDALFHDPRMDNFVPAGIACLVAGLICALPVAVASWLILRRGFAVNAWEAGLAGGTMAGLAGVVMLELHCPNFRTLHVVVWHTAVIPLSGLAGAAIAQAFRTKRSAAELMQ
jgi:hypothetical protein